MERTKKVTPTYQVKEANPFFKLTVGMRIQQISKPRFRNGEHHVDVLALESGRVLNLPFIFLTILCEKVN